MLQKLALYMEKKENPKKSFLKKLWWFIWEDDSIWSWIINILLAFILIKFLVYPGLGLVFGTQYPIVAVVSGSMEHDGNFETWWESPAACAEICTQEKWYNEFEIEKEEFKDFKFKNGFNKGDIMFLRKANPKKLKIGDVLVFQSPYRPEPIIHRIVKITEENEIKVYQTKGDHNVASGKHDFKITEGQLLGKAWFRAPFLGWIKIGFVKLMSLVGIQIM
jgi:signal peptidase I